MAQFFLFHACLKMYEVIPVTKRVIAKPYIFILGIPVKMYKSTNSSTETKSELNSIFSLHT